MSMTNEAAKKTRKTAPKPANRRAGETAAAAPLKPASNRAERAAERRGAIIEAAMDEFIARGFAATRLDDVASAPASPRARSICTSRTRNRCSRS